MDDNTNLKRSRGEHLSSSDENDLEPRRSRRAVKKKKIDNHLEGNLFHIGAKIKAAWKQGDTLYPGYIKAVRSNGTYDIKYNDGDNETKVNEDDIEIDSSRVDSDSGENSNVMIQ